MVDGSGKQARHGTRSHTAGDEQQNDTVALSGRAQNAVKDKNKTEAYTPEAGREIEDVVKRDRERLMW